MGTTVRVGPSDEDVERWNQEQQRQAAKKALENKDDTLRDCREPSENEINELRLIQHNKDFASYHATKEVLHSGGGKQLKS